MGIIKPQKKVRPVFFWFFPPKWQFFSRRGYLAGQISGIEGTALNPGKLQCEEITLVFDGGTRLTTFPELRASPQFWKTAEEEVFS